MKPILLTVAILVAGGAAYWGLQTKAELQKTVTENIIVKDETVKQKKVLTSAEQTRDEAQKSRDVAVQASSEAKTRFNSLQDSTVQLETELATATAELEALKLKLANALGGEDQRDPEAMQAEVTRLEEAVKSSQGRMEELATLLKASLGKSEPLTAELKRYQERRAKYVSEIERNAIEYAVTAIDPKWGFVVFNAGESAALDPAVPLIIVRNGQRMAMLRITSIDKNQTVADIIPSSIKPGNKIQVGDKVILKQPQG